ncbi:MAG: hypothetical protein ACM3ON_10775 [Chloroflexota bacterium]
MKLYGICLERLSHLVRKAKKRLDGHGHWAWVILESYNTGNLDDIVDILEIEDIIEERTQKGLRKELAYLASALSEVTGETLSFEYCEAGHLGLYLTVADGEVCTEELVGAYA